MLVWTPHTSFLKEAGVGSCYAFPILQRRGGLLLALPEGFLSEELLLDGAVDGAEGAVGPSKVFEATLLEEDESGSLAPTEFVKSFLVVDLADDCLSDMQVFGEGIDPDQIFPFEDSMPAAFPRVADVVPKVFEWCDSAVSGRAHFYSAREEPERPAMPKRATPKRTTNAALVDQIAALSAQVKLLSDQHQEILQAKSSSSADRVPDPVIGGSMAARLPSLAAHLGISQTPAKASQLLGPPPRVRQTERASAIPLKRDDDPSGLGAEVVSEDPVVQAIATQSTALTALVAHLAGGTDALHDLSGGSSSQLSMSGRGVARRERMQQHLAARSSGFFLQVQQQLYKRMNPSRQVPRTQAEVTASGASMTAYLERYGGYRHARDAGLALWVAAHAMDCAAAEDFAGTKEFLALLVAAKCFGWIVESCVGADIDGRPSGHAFCRSHDSSCFPRPSILTTDSARLGCHQPCVPARNRVVGDQEGRGEAYKDSEVSARRARRREQPFPQKEAKVSKEAKGRPSSKGGKVIVGGTMSNSGGSFGVACGGKSLLSENSVLQSVSYQSGSLPCQVPSKPSVVPNPPLRDSSKSPGDLQMSYPKWCALLVSNVLRSRTPFASYLNISISLSQDGRRANLSPAFFPIPVPPWSSFDRMPAGLSQSKRRLVHLRRAVHVICMALNFWHSGGVFDDGLLLQREPSSSHRCLYGRIVSLIRSDGLASSFSLKKSGRKFPNLIASLGGLSSALTSVGSANPYEKSFGGLDCTLSDEDRAALTPFRDLDRERLVIRGTGHWDATEFLSDYLVMPYREPLVLEAGLDHGTRPFIRDPPHVVAALAKKWDQNNLLVVHSEAVEEGSLVKIFNCYKGPLQDRQIGDRRGRNSVECRVHGPSKLLPSGSDIMDLVVVPSKEKLVLSVTDRSDFYHQISVTKSRAISNTVGPGIPISMLEGTNGLSMFLLSQSKAKRRREAFGDELDRFGQFAVRGSRPGDGLVWVSFNSVLQGDHSGVEVCTDAHTSLLQSFGLLSHHHRLVASSPLLSRSCLEGLVIDDYFCISKEAAATPNDDSVAFEAYQTAQKAYNRFGLLGSPLKDVKCENEGRVIWAYVNSGQSARSRDLVTLGAPPAKRVSLSFITLHLCSMTHTTDSLHLCLLGGWISMLAYRRPLMSILNRSFHLVDQNAFDQNNPRVLPLSREVANELLLLAVLMPLMIHELSADYLPWIFASDASSSKGAVCRAEVGRDVAEVLWRHCKSKGAYTRLLTESFLRKLELFEEHSEQKLVEEPSRPLAFTFDFLEVFAGSAKVTKYVAALGVSVGVPVDLSYSTEFDLRQQHVMRWLSFLVSERRIKCFAVEPPCTTFSIMRRPRLRSKERPLGFSPLDPVTSLGNTLGCRSGQLMYIASDASVAGLWETPFSSYMQHLPAWKIVRRRKNAREVRCDSCCFGSPHLKSFRFVTVNVDSRPLSRRCKCTEKHIQIQGSYTKDSAVYTDQLASCIASVLVAAARAIDCQLLAEDSLRVDGLENQLVNEVALSADWSVLDSWTYKKKSHINIFWRSALF